MPSIVLTAQAPIAPDAHVARLVRTIEAEIIPRLVLARRNMPEALPVPAAALPGVDEIAEFASLVLAPQAAAAAGFIDGLRSRGASVEALYLDLLAPAARRLGELWVADLCDFTQVTVGLVRLQQALHELSPAFQTEAEHREDGRRALLIPGPGEQHTFGLSMVVEFFRRSGWDVESTPTASDPEMIRLVRREWFSVIGMSVSSNVRLGTLAQSIRAIRRASRNRGIGVLVGGSIFNEKPELAALVGADATAVDGRHATLQADHLLRLLPARD